MKHSLRRFLSLGVVVVSHGGVIRLAAFPGASGKPTRCFSCPRRGACPILLDLLEALVIVLATYLTVSMGSHDPAFYLRATEWMKDLRLGLIEGPPPVSKGFV